MELARHCNRWFTAQLGPVRSIRLSYLTLDTVLGLTAGRIRDLSLRNYQAQQVPLQLLTDLVAQQVLSAASAAAQRVLHEPQDQLDPTTQIHELEVPHRKSVSLMSPNRLLSSRWPRQSDPSGALTRLR